MTDLTKIATSFRRNGVNLDVVNLRNPDNMDVLGKMHEIVNVEDESHQLNYDEDLTLLVDALKGSAIMGNIGA